MSEIRDVNWPASKPCALIVHEHPAETTTWLAEVESLCAPGRDGTSGRAGELDLVLLHGARPWVESWIRSAPNVGSPFGLVVVLAPWSSEGAAQLLRQAADDVVAPTVEGAELCARIHAVLRRVRGASVGSAKLGMRRAERKLLEYLRASPGRVVTQSELLDNVFGGVRRSGTSLVRVHVSRLRRRLGSVAALRTIRGAGYVLEVDERRGG
jgi:DNA-binding response OmpR family regulator